RGAAGDGGGRAPPRRARLRPPPPVPDRHRARAEGDPAPGRARRARLGGRPRAPVLGRLPPARVDGRPRRRRRGRAVRLRRPRERPRRRRGGARPGAGDRRAAAAAAPAPRRPLLRACPRGARRGRGGEGGACRGAAAPARGRQLVGPCGGEGEPRSARRQRPRRRRRGAVASGPLRARRRARGDRRIGPARGRRRRGGRVNGLLPPSSAVGWVVAVCFLYLLATYAAYGFLLAVSVAERKMRGGSRREGEDERVRSSSLTIPVTIVAPLYNEAPIAVDSVGSFLAC